MSTSVFNSQPAVWSDNSRDLGGLASSDVWSQLDAHGAIVFRGFEVDSDRFYQFASGFNHRFLSSPFGDRQSVGAHEGLQTVTLGQGRLGLHFEYGNSPLRPDVLWFHCRCAPAADSGGETLVADGAAIHAHLSEALRSVLRTRRVKCVNYLPRLAYEAFERLMFGGQAGGPILAHLRRQHNFAIREKNERRVVFEFEVSPIAPVGERGHMAICQNLFTDAYMNPDDAQAETAFSTMMTWDDDKPIEPSIVQELREVAAGVTRGIRWKAGDFVMIDNNRFLHGRSATRDPRRDIVMLSSFSKRFARQMQAV